MSDFHQPGLITTLHHLRPTSEELVGSLRDWTRRRPTALLLPCHGPDLRRSALARMAGVLREADYLQEILVVMNGLGSGDWDLAQDRFRNFPVPLLLLNNDDPDLQKRYVEVLGREVRPGKGFNLWSGLLLMAARGRVVQVATHDCDILSYHPDLLIRLVLPLAAPDLAYRFCKGYYSRVTERLYGRVTRLFAAPLLRTLIRVAGHHPMLDYLDAFRYPLSGECSFTLDAAARWEVSAHWGLEVGLLCESHRHLEAEEVCQVDLAARYDHKHQLPGAPGAGGLAGMCREIALALLDNLVREGLVIDAPFAEALKRTYRRVAGRAVKRYADDACFNSLQFDRTEEERLANLFSEVLDQALEEFLAGGGKSPSLPPVEDLQQSDLARYLAKHIRPVGESSS